MNQHIAVIGAGAFGGWTALHLLRRGAQVTLIDAWGPGHTRASSGGESRVIRGIYGPDGRYTQWVARSFDLWAEHEARWNRQFYFPTGALWFFTVENDHYARAALPHLQAANLPAYELPKADLRRRFPAVHTEDLHTTFYEEKAGYLLARRACAAVRDGFVAEGGTYIQDWVRPETKGDETIALCRTNGTRLHADVYLFACGPWLGTLFPDVFGSTLQVSKQPLYYFGLPPGNAGLSALPVWVEYGKRIYYGIPNSEYRGFKVADDTRGPDFDPTHSERQPPTEDLNAARACLKRRFVGMGNAPLLEARVCQYTNTPDGHYLIDRHPASENTWFLGGGCGHGFKLGPALGEYAADLLLADGTPNPLFSLNRLQAPHPRQTQFQST